VPLLYVSVFLSVCRPPSCTLYVFCLLSSVHLSFSLSICLSFSHLHSTFTLSLSLSLSASFELSSLRCLPISLSFTHFLCFLSVCSLPPYLYFFSSSLSLKVSFLLLSPTIYIHYISPSLSFSFNLPLPLPLPLPLTYIKNIANGL